MKTIILKLGGSIFFPETLNIDYLMKLKPLIEEYSSKYRFIIIVGGGHICRVYQNALKKLINSDDKTGDWMGIDVTKLNARFFKRIFSGSEILRSLDEEIPDNNIVIASGYEPGYSTDYDTMELASRFDDKKIVMLSNIKKIYTDDPKKNPDAKPIDSMTWEELHALVGDDWVPGKNVPMDPSAVKEGLRQRVKVVFADGNDLDNFKNILDNKKFDGTTIE